MGGVLAALGELALSGAGTLGVAVVGSVLAALGADPSAGVLEFAAKAGALGESA